MTLKTINRNIFRLLIAIIFSIHTATSGQFKLVTENLIISSISGESDTFEYKGPYFDFDCKLLYVGEDTTITVTDNYYDFYVNYRFEGNIYTTNPLSWDFQSCSEVLLSNKDTIALSFSDHIFYWNHDLYKGDGDYSLELMETLPTLTVCLHFLDSLVVCSCDFINVKIE